MTPSPDAIEKLLWVAASSLGTLAVSYFVMGMRVSNELAFVKGQLITLMAHFSTIQQVKEKHAVLDKAHEKTRFDVNHLFERVKSVEAKHVNGSGHG